MSNTKLDDFRIIEQTKKWINTVIIAHNYCPFAKREVQKGSVRYNIVRETEFNSLLKDVMQECVWLDQNADTETTLIIFPSNLNDFNSFLDCLVLAEDLLIAQGYEGVYQIASFHPNYCFQGAEQNDPANFTNRSPYPMFHLIREASVEAAIENHPDADSIPERNVEYARQQGLANMESLFKKCMEIDENDS